MVVSRQRIPIHIHDPGIARDRSYSEPNEAPAASSVDDTEQISHDHIRARDSSHRGLTRRRAVAQKQMQWEYDTRQYFREHLTLFSVVGCFVFASCGRPTPSGVRGARRSVVASFCERPMAEKSPIPRGRWWYRRC